MFKEKKLFLKHLSPTAGLFNLGELNRPCLHRDKRTHFLFKHCTFANF